MSTPASSLDLPAGVAVTGPLKPGYERVLTREALEFVASLARNFEARRKQLIEARKERQQKAEEDGNLESDIHGGSLVSSIHPNRKAPSRH